ncbi:MAG: YihA family ribosome biogenesis GTP-binding protein [Bacteroidetes bacterium]|nr:MAG: YihA family ribosome biogenesis GTP-binding protein [Bacteroidota bacterium]PTM12970.1 MAG: YihA family ribosome biogenesis GTP-binding protein [Bacteroidota bacterium]
MVIQSVEFKGSFPEQRLAPADGRPEFAFIGRSNVGKSSLINMLVDRKDLARISNVPGKTQHLNYYLINDNWYLVDLPGYGYAKVSKKLRQSWRLMMDHYFKKRENLQCVFVLLDSNIGPQKIDLEFINWLGEMGMPFVVAYTKSDRILAPKLTANIEKIRAALLEYWEELPPDIVTSATNRIGQEEVFQIIEETLERL